MDKNGVFGEVLEQGQNTAKAAVSDVTNSVKGQVGVAKSSPLIKSDGFGGALKSQVGLPAGNTNSPNAADGFAGAIKNQAGLPDETGGSKNTNQGHLGSAESSERTKEVVSEFYEPTDNSLKQAQTQEQITTQNNLAKTREELLKFQDLHKQVYYEPLFAYENKKPNQEESTAERVEKQEMADLNESKKKEESMTPIAVQRAQTSTEVNRGVAG